MNVAAIVIMYVSMSVLYGEIADGKCDPNIAGKVYSSVLKRTTNTRLYIAMLGLQLLIYFIILFTLTPMILVKLYQHWLIRRQLTATEQDVEQYPTSVKLKACVVAFLFFVALPHGIAIDIGLGGTRLNNTNQTCDLLSWLSLAMLLNYLTNFLLYNLFGAEFRMKALMIFGLGKEPRPEMITKTSAKDPEEAETSFTRM